MVAVLEALNEIRDTLHDYKITPSEALDELANLEMQYDSASLFHQAVEDAFNSKDNLFMGFELNIMLETYDYEDSLYYIALGDLDDSKRWSEVNHRDVNRIFDQIEMKLTK